MPEQQFKVDWRGQSVVIEPHLHNNSVVYKCLVQEQVLLLTTGVGAGGQKFWTFLPPKDKKAAAELGKLIDEHTSKQ